MNWIKSIYKKYMAGARANDFPISKYGLLGERLHKAQESNDE